VRYLVVCDEVVPSETEGEVYTLEGVRQHFSATSFPCVRSLSLFLLISCPRAGRYQGKVLVVNDRNDRTTRYAKFPVTFRGGHELLPRGVDLEACEFPEAGWYTIQVWFSISGRADVLKYEQPFFAAEGEE
jgi:hypothetical protein